MLRAPSALLASTVLLLASTAQATVPDVPAESFGEGPIENGEAAAEVRLLTDHVVVSAGASLRVGVLFTLDPGWHIY